MTSSAPAQQHIPTRPPSCPPGPACQPQGEACGSSAPAAPPPSPPAQPDFRLQVDRPLGDQAKAQRFIIVLWWLLETLAVVTMALKVKSQIRVMACHQQQQQRCLFGAAAAMLDGYVLHL